jgi:hypothetical protein
MLSVIQEKSSLSAVAFSLQALALDGKNIAATTVSFIGGALANAAGVGGGGLFVPMFNLLLGFDAKTATSLSQGEKTHQLNKHRSFKPEKVGPDPPASLRALAWSTLLKSSRTIGFCGGMSTGHFLLE